jgi:hypothetical protein
MQRYQKILVAVAVAVAIVVIAVIVALRFLPETDLIRDSLRDRLSAMTGHDVRLGALNVSLSFPHMVNLTLEGISISSKEGKRLLSADRLALSPSLDSIFSGQVLIQSVTVKGARLFVRRSRDGTVEDPFVRPQVSAPSTEEKQKVVGTSPPEIPSEPDAKSKTVPAEPDSKPKTVPAGADSQRLKWSVDTVKISDARIEWIDREIMPREPVRICLKRINGVLHRNQSDNTFSVNLEARLTRENQKGSAIKADGTLHFAPDLSDLLAANLEISLRSLDLKTFRDYVPPSARLVEKFDVASSRVEVAWKKGQTTRISFLSDVSGKAVEAPQLKFQGTSVLTEDFSKILEIRGTGESDRLPLRLFHRYFPKDLPIDPKTGTVKASLEGYWKQDQTWRIEGNIGLENAVPTGRFKQIANNVRIWSQAKLTPHKLRLESIEISGPTTLAALAGTVTNPFSENREVDLEGRVNLKPGWLRPFGVKLPKEVEVKGTVPVQGRGRGKKGFLWVDLRGDLTSAGLKWAPYLEKDRGNKGTISIKGNFLSRRPSRQKRETPEVQVLVGISGATVRTRQGGPRLSDCAVHFDSRLLLNSNGPDLKGATLALRRGSGARNIMRANADVSDVGSGSSRINGKVMLNVNRTTLTMAGIDLPNGVQVIGSSQLIATIRGSVNTLSWSVHLPLTNLDVRVNNAFKKPGGVKGDLSASGKWALKELVLSKGKVTLPGLSIHANGNLRDRNGKFRGLTLSAKRADLRQLARLVPELSGKGLSGSIDTTMTIRPSGKGVATNGRIVLLAVDYQPDPGWSIENARGTVETDGTYVKSRKLTGSLKGPIEGPLTVKGELSRLQTIGAMNGRVSVDIGKGSINAGSLRRVLGQAQILINALFRPGGARAGSDRLAFDSGSCNITIGSGTAKTEDLRLNGPDMGIGAMGSVQLRSMTLDILLGIKTYTVVPGVLGKIPAVRKLVKQHEGLLKALGVDKELKRLGIGEAEKQTGKPEQTGIKKTPVTVILKATGPASSPEIGPVLEQAVSKNKMTRLKSLMN